MGLFRTKFCLQFSTQKLFIERSGVDTGDVRGLTLPETKKNFFVYLIII